MPEPLPPFARVPDFLSVEDHGELLRWTLANKGRFRPATVTATVSGGTLEQVEPATRVALTCRDFEPDLSWLRERFLAVLNTLAATTGVRLPPIDFVELELAAHGDGAHYAPHVDIPIGPDRQPLGGRPDPRDERLLSAVYYYHAEPKGFSGGNLRLYRFGGDGRGSEGDEPDHLDIAPEQNLLVAFPTWARHEVRRVACPSGRFEDYRFAVNCWYCGKLKS